MTESIPPEHYREGHLPNTEVIVLDLHRLVTTFFSSQQLAELRTENAHDPIGWLQQYEEDEITRILLSTAITARIIDDRDGHYLDRVDTTCGELIEDLSTPDKNIPLNLREACNKIIHAKKIHSDITEINYKNHMNPIMYFYGDRNGVEWKATLNILDYAIKYVESIAM